MYALHIQRQHQKNLRPLSQPFITYSVDFLDSLSNLKKKPNHAVNYSTIPNQGVLSSGVEQPPHLQPTVA